MSETVFGRVASAATPYADYREMRARGGAVPLRPAVWLLADHAAVVEATTDARLSSAFFDWKGFATAIGETPRRGTGVHWLIHQDGERHRQLRRMLAPLMTTAAMRQLRPTVEAEAERLWALCAAQGPFDLLDDFAYPFAAAVMSRLLRLPGATDGARASWVKDMAHVIALSRSTSNLLRISRANFLFLRHLRDELHDPATGSRLPELLTSAAEAGVDEDRLLHNLIFFFDAGVETTANFICNSLVSLEEHPDQYEALTSGTCPHKQAVEELLRFEAPVQGIVRVAKEDMPGEATGGICRRDLVVLLLGSANRDQDHWARSDELDLGRDDGPHVSFGHGAHYCLGAPLARLEAEIAVGLLARHHGRLRPVDPVAWCDRGLIRATSGLRVTIDDHGRG
jgi:cytochrome P450